METVDEIEDLNREQLEEKVSVPVNDIYISVYDMNGSLLAGIVSTDCENKEAFAKDASRKLKSGGQEWFLYDTTMKKEHGTYFGIRGILPIHDTVYSEDIFLRFLVIALPFLVLGVALVGYFENEKRFTADASP